jgi:integrase
MTVRLATGGRKCLYLGVHGRPETAVEYKRVCRLLDRNGGTYPGGEGSITVVEALAHYHRHAVAFYGERSYGVIDVRRTIRTIRMLFGKLAACEFGPKCLKTVVDQWVQDGLSRKTINQLLGTAKRCWRWLASEELVSAETWHGLQAVSGLRSGRTSAPDGKPVRPAVRSDVEAALEFLSPTVAAVVRLQLLTGSRCGEIVRMKSGDVDRSAEKLWVYSPPTHKTSWRGRSREILFGAVAQAVLAPFLLRAGDGYVFSPARAEEDRLAERSAKRETPRWESHLRRNEEKRVPDRARPPGQRYSTQSIRRAIERACDAAGVPRFTPHRLRHLAALEIRTRFGVEHARASLGHTIAAMTECYSRDVDRKLAGEVAAAAG